VLLCYARLNTHHFHPFLNFIRKKYTRHKTGTVSVCVRKFHHKTRPASVRIRRKSCGFGSADWCVRSLHISRFYARKQLLLSARLSHRNSVCPSVTWVKKKIPHRPRSVAWELIPFTVLWAGKGEAGAMAHLPAGSHPPQYYAQLS